VARPAAGNLVAAIDNVPPDHARLPASDGAPTMDSTPVSDLARLVATMSPERRPGAWAWCVLPHSAPGGEDARRAALAAARPVATVLEDEGLTVVVPEGEAAERGWPVAFRAAWITLRVHSDLHAVGLTAAVSRALADAGIACNVIAGAHHDHLFVPVGRADDAMRILGELQAGAPRPA